MPADVTPLVPNASPWERAMEQVSGTRWAALDIAAIARSKDPWTCDESALPFLAFELSVDLWDDAWPVEKKRWAVANAIRLHRLKGTEAGAAAHLALAGSRLVRAVTPPSKTFIGASLTDDERRAWLARFPQLRIYPYIATRQARFGNFSNAAGGLGKAFAGRIFPHDTGARDRFRREAWLFEPRDGSLTLLTHRVVTRHRFGGEAVQAQEIVLPAVRSTAWYAGDAPKAKRFFGRSGITQRVVTIRTPLTYGYSIGQEQYFTVPPGLDPIDIRPAMVREEGPVTHGTFFAGRPLVRGFLPPSRAWRRIYEQVHLHDPERLPLGGPPTTHLRGTRLSFPVKTAHVRAEIRARRSARAFGRFAGGYLIPGDRRPLDAAVRALAASKALSDRIYLNSKSVRAMRADFELR